MNPLKTQISDFYSFCVSQKLLKGTSLGRFPAKAQSILGRKLTSPYLTPEECRKIFLYLGGVYGPQIFAVQMLKGGVAKTTTTLNLGLRSAMLGAKILFVDMDQQANLTYALGVDSEELPVFIDVFEKKKSITECILNLDGHIDLLPSNLNNSVLERSMMQSPRNWSGSVAAALQLVRHRYDFIWIDTAPALSMTNTAVTLAADTVLLPVNPDKFSYKGLEKNWEELEVLEEDFGVKKSKKILFTRYDAREKSSVEILEQCRSNFGQSVLSNYIRTSTEVKNNISSPGALFYKSSGVKEDFDHSLSQLI